MPSRKKWSPLEEEVWALWHRLVFDEGHSQGLPRGDAWWLALYERQAEDWLRLQRLSSDEGEWKIGVETAAAVMGSVWHKCMLQRRFAEAEESAQKLLSHPHLDRASRAYGAEFPIYLEISRIAQGRVGPAANALMRVIHAGPYPPSTMARDVARALDAWSELFVEEPPVEPELRELALEIARLRKLPKRLMTAIEDCASYDQLMKALERATDQVAPRR